jgi:cysteine-rich repeat protein
VVEPAPSCGDGTLDAGEACDDGNLVNGDGCDDQCVVEPAPSCGDGTLDAGEACDDGNLVNGDGCDDQCVVEPAPTCGDSVTDPGEECDDGNTSNTDSCLNTCNNAACGDGYVQAGVEECDDGNSTSGDGCSVACVVEAITILSNVHTSPSSFIPEDGEKISLMYDLNQDAEVDVGIYDGLSLVVLLFDDVNQNSGSYNIKWNGKVSGDEVDPGTYKLKVTAKANSIMEQEEDNFEVEGFEPVPDEVTCEGINVVKPNITNDDVDPSIFNPDEELVYISFDLNTCAKVNVRIWKSGEIVTSLTEGVEKDEGTYEYRWDGVDDDGDYVNDGFYTYQVYAWNDEGSEAVNDVFEVDYDKEPGGDPVSSADQCAGFKDVSEDNTYCPALEFTAIDLECITGYPDGTAKLSKMVQQNLASF